MTNTDDEWAIEVTDLRRVYHTYTGVWRRTAKSIVALAGVSLRVQPGEIFGLIGPNGAGKTTLIKILTTLLLPTSGSARVAGYDVTRQTRPVRERINFVFGGERGLYWRLSGWDNLRYFADLYNQDWRKTGPRAERLMHMVGLWDRRHERVEGYSKGMKQRLHIAKAMINEPRVLFLDEPTIGLDPEAARTLRELIREVRTQGVAVLVTSHVMPEMRVLCDRIAVIQHGRVVAEGTPESLEEGLRGYQILEVQLMGQADRLQEHLAGCPEVTSVAVTTQGHTQTAFVATRCPEATLQNAQSALAGADVLRTLVRPPDLEDAYFQLLARTSA